LPPKLTDLVAQSEAKLMRDVEMYLPHNIEKEFYDVPDYVARSVAVPDDISVSSGRSSPVAPRPPKRTSLTLHYV
jgi:hypothetical protein